MYWIKRKSVVGEGRIGDWFGMKPPRGKEKEDKNWNRKELELESVVCFSDLILSQSF